MRPAHLFVPPALLALVLAAAPAAGQEREHRGLLERRGPETDGDWTEWRSLSGDWGGLRTTLAERGASFALSAIVDLSRPFGDAVRERGAERILLDATLELDLGVLFGWDDTVAFAEGYAFAGDDGSADVGDAQVYSNIDEADVTQLAELWIERRVRRSKDGATDPLRVKLGKLDANSEFAHVEAGLPFLHSSAGFSPTLFLLPSYPDPALSLNVFASPADGVRLGLGAYNAARDGAVSGRRGLTADLDAMFWIGQADVSWAGGRAAVGAWHHTGDLPRFDGRIEDGTGGWYALVEQRLDADDAGPDWTGFAQLGAADDEVGEFARHVAAGVLATGLCPAFANSRSGLYVTHVDLTDAPAAGLGGSELAIEIFQEIRLTPSLVVKPDLQWIHDPGGREVDAAWIATLRIELAL